MLQRVAQQTLLGKLPHRHVTKESTSNIALPLASSALLSVLNSNALFKSPQSVEWFSSLPDGGLSRPGGSFGVTRNYDKTCPEKKSIQRISMHWFHSQLITTHKVSKSAPHNYYNYRVGDSRGMFIQTQNTPNPTSLMFIPTGKPVLSGEERSKNFSNAREAMASPLAKKLFLIDGVTQVFFASDFVTVSKDEDASWSVLKPEIFAAMTEFYASNEPILYDSDDTDVAKNNNLIKEEEDDEVVAMIKELLETRIRPAVQEDGGDIVFCDFDHDCGVVTLKMMGACSGCPSSSVTLKSGIENMLMHYIPEVKGVVEADADEAEVESDKAFQRLEQHLST